MTTNSGRLRFKSLAAAKADFRADENKPVVAVKRGGLGPGHRARRGAPTRRATDCGDRRGRERCRAEQWVGDVTATDVKPRSKPGIQQPSSGDVPTGAIEIRNRQ